MIRFGEYFLVSEGGAGGHMPHPIDMVGINTGPQLTDLFNKIVAHIKEKSAATKIDGTNNSLRIVDGPNGKEFAVDRGSMKELDLAGITLSKLEQQWPNKLSVEPGGNVKEDIHGMVKSNQILLGIMNDALPHIEPELKSLGLWNAQDARTARYLNCEFVEAGGSNVIKYGKNFIAFHGINKYKHNTGVSPKTKRRVNNRKGAELVSSKTGEPTYNTRAFERLVDKVHAISKSRDFDTHGVIPVRFNAEPNFQEALDTKVTIINANNSEDTRTLDLWLSNANNPTGKKVTLLDGKKDNVMKLDYYEYVIGDDNRSTGPLNEMFADDNVNLKGVIDAAVMWHATRLLGRAILTNLETHMGADVPVGEGIVIRGMRTSPRAPKTYPAFKVSGDFIVMNRRSGFGI